MICRSRPTKSPLRKGFVVGCALIFGAMAVGDSCYANGTARNSAEIEYIAPDGQFSSLTANPAVHKPSASFVDRDTISCALREGETTFIIQLPKNSPPDRFTFLNENAAACGELRIAVSDSPLPADSPKWTEVDGIVPFAHKRLFKLSMLGVETKFVRLSFKVEAEPQNSVRISDPFRNSFLAAEIGSSFTERFQHDLDLSFVTSVGALWAKQN
ncbi:MAG TPA: hypothetical protein VJ281_09235 [Chthoniobacterales bacterium]|jgi:hypothetical protein|nr:hypothetical protein [Chthoniobacterales bacterium]